MDAELSARAHNQDGSGRPAESLEEALLRIQGVGDVRVVLDGAGRVCEVHVVTDDARGPKQIVRDVQSVALAKFGIDVDYRVVSVVQLQQAVELRPVAPPPAEPDVPRLVSVSLTSEAHVAAVDVRLDIGGQVSAGSARAPGSRALHAGAEAILVALSSYLGSTVVSVEDVAISAGVQPVAVVTLRYACARGEDVRSVAHLVTTDPVHAVACATIEAASQIVASVV